MKSLREHIRELQITENKAAEKAGMRFLLLDENKLMGKESKEYIEDYIDQLELDIFQEAVKAAKLGLELKKAIRGK